MTNTFIVAFDKISQSYEHMWRLKKLPFGTVKAKDNECLFVKSKCFIIFQ